MKKIILILYLAIQLILYLLSVFINNDLPLNILEYLIIVINFFFALYLTKDIKNKDSMIALSALFFTLIADTFLVLLANYLLVAMISFTITQSLYYYRIKNLNNEKTITKRDLTRFISVISFLLIMILITIKNIQLLILITTVYFLMLLFNFIDSLKSFKKYPYLTIGLLLFICCDIFVGLNFLKESLAPFSFLYNLTNINFNMVWLFYAPSQVLLTVSILLINKRKASIV